MKRIIGIIIIILISFDIINASTMIDNNFYLKINNSLDNYINSRLYLIDQNDINQIPYQFETSSSYNNNYPKVGLLNLKEFLIAGSTKSYLYHPRIDWMMTIYDSYNTYAITMNDNGYDSINNNTYGEISPTRFIKSDVKVSGEGTYRNPWIFDSVNEKSNYVVNHYIQSKDGSSYSLYKTNTYTTDTYNYVMPSVENITGFYTPLIKRVKVLPDNSTKIDYYYERKKYSLSINKGTGINSVSGEGTYYYEQEVNISATLSTGYSWDKWTLSGTTPTVFNTSSQNQRITIGNGNITLTANAKNSVPVIVQSGCGSVSGQADTNNGAGYADKRQLTLSARVSNATTSGTNVTIYWTVNKYSISTYINGGRLRYLCLTTAGSKNCITNAVEVKRGAQWGSAGKGSWSASGAETFYISSTYYNQGIGFKLYSNVNEFFNKSVRVEERSFTWNNDNLSGGCFFKLSSQ